MFSDPKRSPNQSDHVLGANSLSAGETDRIWTLIEHWTSDLMAGRIAEWERFWVKVTCTFPQWGDCHGGDRLCRNLRSAYRPI